MNFLRLTNRVLRDHVAGAMVSCRHTGMSVDARAGLIQLPRVIILLLECKGRDYTVHSDRLWRDVRNTASFGGRTILYLCFNPHRSSDQSKDARY